MRLSERFGNPFLNPTLWLATIFLGLTGAEVFATSLEELAAARAEATLPNTPGFTLPPQQMLGATLGYSLDDNLKIDLSLTNLTNQPNWTSNGAMFHGEPRAMSVSLSYKY
jgi:outer membrane receptor protein involved in Fe transport